MKRTIFLVMLAVCAVALVFAQPNIEGNNSSEVQPGYQQGRSPARQPDQQRGQGHHHGKQFDGTRKPEFNRPRGDDANRPSPPQAEDATVSGNLTLVKGMIAVKDNDVTYFAGGLHRFVGFIDGLKEGAAVTLEGKAVTFPQNEGVKFLRVQKLTLNGKDYDIAPPRTNFQNGERRPGMSQHMHQPWRQPMNHSRNQKRIPRNTPQDK